MKSPLHPLPPLPAELTIYSAGEVHAGLLAWMAHDADELGAADALAPVDASAVEVVDGAGVQLLLSLARTLRGHDLELRLASPSRTLSAALDTLGVAAMLVSGRSAQP